MKCGKLLIKVNNDPFYSDEEIWKILNTAAGLSATLYSLDYHGFRHGVSIDSRIEDEHYIEVIFYNENQGGLHARINETFNDIIKDIKRTLNEYKLKIKYIGRDVVPYIDIPEDDFTEHYFIYSFHDVEHKKEW